MSEQLDKQENLYFTRVSAELMRSLRRCHVLVEDYRAHFDAANSNEPPFLLAASDGEDEAEA